MANQNNVQTGLMGTYDTNNAYFMADGKTAYGYGATTFFRFTYDNMMVSIQQDPQGTAVSSLNGKTGGTFTLTLNQMSPFNKVLDELADEHRPGGFPPTLATVHVTILALTLTSQRKQMAAQLTKLVSLRGQFTYSMLLKILFSNRRLINNG